MCFMLTFLSTTKVTEIHLPFFLSSQGILRQFGQVLSIFLLNLYPTLTHTQRENKKTAASKL